MTSNGNGFMDAYTVLEKEMLSPQTGPEAEPQKGAKGFGGGSGGTLGLFLDGIKMKPVWKTRNQALKE